MSKYICCLLFFIVLVLTAFVLHSSFTEEESCDSFIVVDFENEGFDNGRIPLTLSETWLFLSRDNTPNEEAYKCFIREKKSFDDANLLLPFSSIVAGDKEIFVQYDKANNGVFDEKFPHPVVYKSIYKKLSPICIQIDMLRQGWMYNDTYYSERIAVFLHFEIIDLLTKIEYETTASIYCCQFISSMNYKKIKNENVFPGEMLYHDCAPYKVTFLNKNDIKRKLGEGKYKIIPSGKEKEIIYTSSIFSQEWGRGLYYFSVDD